MHWQLRSTALSTGLMICAECGHTGGVWILNMEEKALCGDVITEFGNMVPSGVKSPRH